MKNFATEFRRLLSDEAEHLLDCLLRLMQQDIADGWRAFYARELWFEKHLPPPLLDQLGREYMIERLREAIWRMPGKAESSYHSPVLEMFLDAPQFVDDYRNYLDVGVLYIEAGREPCVVLDSIANLEALELMESKQIHLSHAIRADEHNWYMEAMARATLTPQLIATRRQKETPARLPGVPLAEDGCYWRAIHHIEWSSFREGHDYLSLGNQDITVALMSHIAPEFPYMAVLSTVNRLIFAREGDGPLTWALMFDRKRLYTKYQPPQLILVERHHNGAIEDVDIIFSNVIGKKFFTYVHSTRALETELLFHVSRGRRLIDFYAPFVDEAIQRAAADDAGSRLMR